MEIPTKVDIGHWFGMTCNLKRGLLYKARRLTTCAWNDTERIREKRQHKSGARQACGAAADTERVVLHAVNQNPNDCRGQSYLN